MPDQDNVMLAPPKRMRFSVVPKPTVIEIERPNAFKASDDDPETMVVELKAWPAGPGSPVWIEIALEAASDAYLASIREEEARRAAAGEYVTNDAGERRYIGPTHQINQILATYRRDLLCAAIEDLPEHEAALLVRPDGPWEEILVSLGRWQRRPAIQEPPSKAGAPEAAGEEASAPSSPA